MTIRIASFDIGKINFAFYIEEIQTSKLEKLKSLPSIARYNKNGTPTDKMKEVLTQVYLSGKTILHKNVDITQNCIKGKLLDPETFHNMNDVLDKHSDEFDKCDIFIIEQQLSFGKKRNPMATKLGQHCYSYFTFKYGRFKQVIEFPAYHKTQILGAPKIEKQGKKSIRYVAMEKPKRKKWSIEKALEILALRGEESIISSAKKKDDLADTLTQLQAFKYLSFVDKSI